MDSPASLTEPTPNCEVALRNASQRVPQLSDVNVLSRVVAECIKRRWPDKLRRCVANVHNERELEACDDQGVQKIGMSHTKNRGVDDAIAKLATFKDQMCQCADKVCVDTVTEAMTQWGQDMAREGGDRAAAFTEEDSKKLATVTEEMTKCMMKAMTAGVAPAPAAPAARSH